jgi:hypothetical protein
LVLEFLVFWADIEGDGRTGVDAYGEYSRQKLTNEDFLYLFNMIRNIKLARIRERLIIKEKQRERAFQNMTSGLSILSGKEGEYFFSKEQIKKTGIEEKLTKRVRIKEKIDDYYSYFSAFSHVSHSTLGSIADWEAGMAGRDPQSDQYGGYEKPRFTVCYDNLWEVIDLVIVIVVLEKSRFYGYSLPVDLLKVCVAKDDFAKMFFDFITRNKLEAKLPITSMMTQVLRSS